MKNLFWNEEEAAAVLAAMQSIGSVGGSQEPHPLVGQLLESLCDHVLHTKADLSTLPVITPEELASRVTDDAKREQAIQFLVLVPYMPAELDGRQIEQVDRFADALGIAPLSLRQLHMVREDRLKRLAFDLNRHALNEMIPGTGLTKLAALGRDLKQLAIGDKKTARRYQALEDCTDGSLGKTFYVFYRERGFPLPGEKHSMSEGAVRHDLTHILSGCNTDMEGEINVSGFECGMGGGDFGWELLLEAILNWHMGFEFTTNSLGAPADTGHFNPEEVARCFEIGAATNIDLMSDDWDPWTVMDEAVEDLRERYNILGVTGVYLPPPPRKQAD